MRDTLALQEVTQRSVAHWGLTIEDAFYIFLRANGAQALRHRRGIDVTKRLLAAGVLDGDPKKMERSSQTKDLPKLSAESRYNLCLDELGLTDQRGVPTQKQRIG
jgi:hypothetical protein